MDIDAVGATLNGATRHIANLNTYATLRTHRLLGIGAGHEHIDGDVAVDRLRAKKRIVLRA